MASKSTPRLDRCGCDETCCTKRLLTHRSQSIARIVDCSRKNSCACKLQGIGVERLQVARDRSGVELCEVHVASMLRVVGEFVEFVSCELM
jgi:hypothetical protein